MNKYLLSAALLMGSLTLATSCDKDKESSEQKVVNQTPEDLDFNSQNARNWTNYAEQVAKLLVKDSKTLLYNWETQYKGEEAEEGEVKAPVSYADLFNSKDGNETYFTPLKAIEQIIDGCVEISSEVGEKKIGDPINKFAAGQKTEALYAVESWYSWHSRDDYRNNINSIRNALLCSRDGKFTHDASGVSILHFVANKGNHQLTIKTYKAVQAAADAITAIPQPFRNNINSQEAKKAQDACAELNEILDKELKPFLREHADDKEMAKIIRKYTDDVVLPTYRDLVAKNEVLLKKVQALKANPSNQAFEEACEAWLAAREPWETSEAFLFGPVDSYGLDPNMDSWPLDQAAIVNILSTGDFSQFNYNAGDSADDIAAAQNLRGFHTLEYLLFKDGQARKMYK